MASVCLSPIQSRNPYGYNSADQVCEEPAKRKVITSAKIITRQAGGGFLTGCMGAVEQHADIPRHIPTNCANKPTKPDLVSPENNKAKVAYGDKLVFSKAADADDVDGDTLTHTIEIFTKDALGKETIVVSQEVTGTEFVVPDSLDSGRTYFWRVSVQDGCQKVKQENISDVRSFTMASACDSKPGAPTISMAAIKKVDLNPAISVVRGEDEDVSRGVDRQVVRIEISTTSAFSAGTIKYVSAPVIGDSFIVPSEAGLQYGNITYYVRAAQSDACFEMEGHTVLSDVISFETKGDCDTEPSGITLGQPANDATGIAVSGQVFSWEAPVDSDPGAKITYRFILKDKDGREIHSAQTEDLSYSLPMSLSINTYYKWQVEAADSCGQKTLSEERVFRARSFCDNSPTTKPVISQPNGKPRAEAPLLINWIAAGDTDTLIGDTMTYAFIISANSDFSNPILIPGWDRVSATSFTIPANTLSDGTTYYVKLIAKDSCTEQSQVIESDPITFTTAGVCDTNPTTPSLMSPISGRTKILLTPTFTFTKSSDTDPNESISYTLLISKFQDLSNALRIPVLVSNGSSTISYTLTSPLDPSTDYYWSVESKDLCQTSAPVQSGQIFSFRTEGACETRPVAGAMLNPPANATGIPFPVTLEWAPGSDSDNGDAISKYVLQIAADEQFNTIIFEDQNVGATSYAVPANAGLLSGATYWWRAIPYDQCPQGPAESIAGIKFTTAGACDNTPSDFHLLTPAAGPERTSNRPTFTWEKKGDPDAGDIVQYKLEYSTDPSFVSGVTEVYVPAGSNGVVSYTIPVGQELDYGATYHWRVTALDGCQPTANPKPSIEASMSFTVVGDCDTVPGSFALTSPLPEAIGITTPHVFTWARPDDPDPGYITYKFVLKDESGTVVALVDADNLPTERYELKTTLLQNNRWYTWHIEAADSCHGQPEHRGISAERRFRMRGACDNPPLAAGMLTPLEGEKRVSTAILTWNPASEADLAYGDALLYRVQIATDNEFTATSIIKEETVAGTSYTVPSNVLQPGNKIYYWRVVPVDLCSQSPTAPISGRSFMTVGPCDTKPTAGALTSPADNATKVDPRQALSLNWGAGTDADAGESLRYIVEASTSQTFSSLVFPAVTVSGTSHTIPANTLSIGNIRYYWRATPIDACLPTGQTPETPVTPRSFVTIGACDTNPAAFTLTSPADNHQFTTKTVVLSWVETGDPDAGDSVSYTVTLTPASGEAKTYTTIENTVTIPAADLVAGMTYTWKVSKSDTCGTHNPVESSAFTFRVLGPCETAPTAPVIAEPVSFSTAAGASNTIAWSAAADPDAANPGATPPIPRDITYRVSCMRGASEVLGTSNIAALSYTDSTTPLTTDSLACTVTARKAFCSPEKTTASQTVTVTPVSCTPATFPDTDFTAGTATQLEIASGTAKIAEDESKWTVRYLASSGLYPDQLGWTEMLTPGYTWTARDFSNSLLHLSTLGQTIMGRYQKTSVFPNGATANAVGWLARASLRVGSNPNISGLSLWVYDGTRRINLLFGEDRIISFSGQAAIITTNTKDAVHTYEVTGQNTNYKIGKDGVQKYDGSGKLNYADSSNQIYFHTDEAGDSGEAFWSEVSLYAGGTIFPRYSSGSYLTTMNDAGTTGNVGSGATVSWNGSGTGTTVDVFASNSTTKPETSCATISTSGAQIPSTCSGRYVWLKANLTNGTLDDVTLGSCSY